MGVAVAERDVELEAGAKAYQRWKSRSAQPKENAARSGAAGKEHERAPFAIPSRRLARKGREPLDALRII